MRLIRCLLLILSIVVCQSLSAQDHCYETTRQEGIDLYNKGDYQAAAKNFKAAKFCDDLPSDNDLELWLDKCVVDVRLSVRRLEFKAAQNDDYEVEVTTKAKSFKVGKAPSWCTITRQGKSLQVSCEDNVQVAPREAKITITAAGKTAVLEIYQASADLEVVFAPDSVLFSSLMETQKVFVQSNVPDWSVESTPAWVVVERRKDTLQLVCNRNSSPDIREAEVVILASDKQFSLRLSQMPGDTVLHVNKKEVVFGESNSKESLCVKCNMKEWNVKSEDTWVEVEREKDSIKVSVSENTTLFSRHGMVHVACGNRHFDVEVHQRPHVSEFVMPESELKGVTSSEKESVMVTSEPKNLVVYVDDSIKRITPFQIPIDYEHHSVQVGFERREFLFNENQQDIVFNPGLRFAAITFTAPKNIGLRTGFVAANKFGAYAHFQSSMPPVKEFDSDTLNPSGYHFMVGPVYKPIEYAGLYAGVGLGVHEGVTKNGIPNLGFDWEAGVMGFFMNATVSLGIRNTRWGFNSNRTTFVFGIGGYLKRYYDEKMGYCSSDSRRWWSINYMTRPAANGQGVMFGDMGRAKLRTYFKAMYVRPDESLKNVDASFGFVFTPVNGIIDYLLGAGAGISVAGAESLNPTMEVETGFILNIWRFPLTVMLHESDVLHENRHLYVDFGIGFHLGDFKRSSYK